MTTTTDSMTEETTTLQQRTPRWLMVLAVALVTVVVLSAFALSFTVLRDLAWLSGIPANVAWLWPVIVDGTITAATVVLYTARGRGGKGRMPLAALIVFGAASVVGNVAHILMADPASADSAAKAVPAAIAVFVGVIPPVGLIVTVELLGWLFRAGPTRESEVPVASAALVAPAPAVEADMSAPQPEPLGEAVAMATTAPAVHVEPTPEIQRAEEKPTVAPPPPETLFASGGDTVKYMVEHAVETASAPAEASDLAAAGIPESVSGQVDWVISLARSGVDLSSWKTLAERFSEAGCSLTDRTVQRRLTSARELDPQAFTG